MRIPAALGLAAAATLGAVPAQEPPALAVSVRPGTAAPTVAVGPALADAALADAVRSGLPLRLRFRVELWRDGLFDRLADQRAWTSVLAFEPLDRVYVVRDDAAGVVRRVGSFEEARSVLERAYRPPMGADRPGRYYYIATLDIETLSLSDLDELQRWLRGGLEPAVRGGRSVGGAVGEGLKRLFIRVLDLPARRYQARSDRFGIG